MPDPCRSRGARAFLAVALSILSLAAASAETAVPPPGPPAPVSRGELLYSTHCIECHNVQIHWRDRRLVRDWPTLQAQVDRWQRLARLGWTAADIREVAQYLGKTVYRLPPRATDAQDTAIAR